MKHEQLDWLTLRQQVTQIFDDQFNIQLDPDGCKIGDEVRPVMQIEFNEEDNL